MLIKSAEEEKNDTQSHRSSTDVSIYIFFTLSRYNMNTNIIINTLNAHS